MAARQNRAGPAPPGPFRNPVQPSHTTLSPPRERVRESAVAVRLINHNAKQPTETGFVSTMSVSAYYTSAHRLYFYQEPKDQIVATSLDEIRDFGDTPSPNRWVDTISSGRPGTMVQAFECRTAKGIDYLAVKEIPYTSDDDRKAAKNEIDQLLRVRHKHIIAYVGSYESRRSIDKKKLSIMLYPLARWNLAEFLKHSSQQQNGTSAVALPVTHLMRYFACLCRALDHLHKVNIKHRDVKPENILIDQHFNVLFSDFGISRYYNTEDPASNGITDCTVLYGAMEVVNGVAREGMSSDTFSLGCVFLEMATVALGETITRLYEEIAEWESVHRNRRVAYCSAVASGKVGKWFEHLKLRMEPRHNFGEKIHERNHSHAASGNGHLRPLTSEHLDVIKAMMSNSPDERPALLDVQRSFESLRAECEDCDVGASLPDAWNSRLTTFSNRLIKAQS